MRPANRCFRSRRRAGQGSLAAVLTVLVLLVALGAWNYRRNLAAETRSGARPYRALKEKDLQALEQAYRAELAKLQAQAEQQRTQARQRRIRDQGFLAENVKQFEKVRRQAEAERALHARLAEAEAALRQIKKEMRLRDRGKFRIVFERIFRVSF